MNLKATMTNIVFAFALIFIYFYVYHIDLYLMIVRFISLQKQCYHRIEEYFLLYNE